MNFSSTHSTIFNIDSDGDSNLKWNTLHCNKDALTDGYGWFLQCLLAGLAFSCLVAKRFCEPPYIRRPWKTWWYDTSKQGIGAAVIHLTNVYLAPLFQGDPCTWYIINFLLDSTIGLFIIYIGIHICHLLAKKKNIKSINFGEYTTSKSWLHQTMIYVGLMALIKLLTTLIIQFDFWDNVKNFILSPFADPRYELAIVMLIIPFFVNIFIFWVTDNFLMRYKHKKQQHQQQKMKYIRKIIKKRKIKLFSNNKALDNNRPMLLRGGKLQTTTDSGSGGSGNGDSTSGIGGSNSLEHHRNNGGSSSDGIMRFENGGSIILGDFINSNNSESEMLISDGDEEEFVVNTGNNSSKNLNKSVKI